MTLASTLVDQTVELAEMLVRRRVAMKFRELRLVELAAKRRVKKQLEELLRKEENQKIMIHNINLLLCLLWK